MVYLLKISMLTISLQSTSIPKYTALKRASMAVDFYNLCSIYAHVCECACMVSIYAFCLLCVGACDYFEVSGFFSQTWCDCRMGRCSRVERDWSLSGNSVSLRLPHCWAVNQQLFLTAPRQRVLLSTRPITSAATLLWRSRRLDVCLW